MAFPYDIYYNRYQDTYFSTKQLYFNKKTKQYFVMEKSLHDGSHHGFREKEEKLKNIEPYL